MTILLTSCLTTTKNHFIKYCETFYGRNGKNGILKILNKLKSKGFPASSLSTYDFISIYTTLSHNLIKEKLTELNEQTFHREGSLFWLYMRKRFSHFLTT